MRNLMLILTFLGLFQWSCSSAVYVVRHAEKVDESADPDLSAIGKQRAQALADLLQTKGIRQIYSTKYQRTRQTGLPLSQKTGVDIQTYDQLDTLAAQVLKVRKNTLVVGHSNTVLPFLTKLGVTPTMKTIGGGDYDNLFIVYLKGKKAILQETTYGAKTE